MRSTPSPLTGCPGGQLFQYVPESILGPGGGQHQEALPVREPQTKDANYSFTANLSGPIKEVNEYVAKAADLESNALTELVEAEKELAMATARHTEAVKKLLAARKERASAAQAATALSVIQHAMHSSAQQPFTQAMETFQVAQQAPSVAFTHSQK